MNPERHDHPATLDRDGIAQRIPHAGSMCLLDALEAWDAEGLRCRATSHRDPANLSLIHI